MWVARDETEDGGDEYQRSFKAGNLKSRMSRYDQSDAWKTRCKHLSNQE
jgi:hypothetical protein